MATVNFHAPSILLLGKSRSGKTSAVNGIIQQKAALGHTVVYICIKEDVRNLLVNPPIFDQVFDYRELRLSITRPTSTADRKAAASYFVEGLCQIFGLQLSRANLYTVSDQLLASFQRYRLKTGKSHDPSPWNVEELIRRSKSKYNPSVESVLQIFKRTVGPTFRYSRGYFLDELLLGKRTAIVISDVAERRAFSWVVFYLVNALYRHLAANGPNDGSELVTIVLDDCHIVFGRDSEREQLSPISQLLMVWMQAGMRLYAISQYPADVSPALIAQSSVLVQIGPLSTVEDCRVVSSGLGIFEKEGIAHLQSLQTGEFIARDPRYPRPFGGRIRDFTPLPNVGVTEEERKRMMRPVLDAFDSHPSIPIDVVERALKPTGRIEQHERSRGTLSNNAETLGTDVIAHPFDSLGVRRKRLDWGASKLSTARTALVDAKLVRQHQVPSRRGHDMALLEPLRSLAESLNTPLPSWSRGGFKHAYGQHVNELFCKREGFREIRTEWRHNGKDWDVFWLDDGRPCASEITVHLGNCVENAVRAFRALPELHSLFFVCFGKSEIGQVTRMLDAAPELAPVRERIRIIGLHELQPGTEATS